MDIERNVYTRDFEDYRRAQDRIIRTQREFFPDALTRGGTMYEAGYRLSDALNPPLSELQADSFWQGLAAKAAAVVDFSSRPETPFPDLLSARIADTRLMPAAFSLLEIFAEYHVAEPVAAGKARFEDHVKGFEAERDMLKRIERAQQFAEYVRDPNLGFDRFDALASFLVLV